MMFNPEFNHILHSEGITTEVYLFVAPIILKHDGLRIGVDYPQSDCFYWSWDAAGTVRLSLEERDSLAVIYPPPPPPPRSP
jgi:hypothetical protein